MAEHLPAQRISRSDMIAAVDQALDGCGCAASTADKLRVVAKTTDAVAVGWFHCGDAFCPASQADRRHQGFQTAFDRLMAERFGRDWDAENPRGPFKPFVVTVDD